MVKHTKGFKGLSKKVLSAILAASMIMTSSSFVMAAETEEPVPVESTANDVETTEETEVEETEEATNEVATFAAPEAADANVGNDDAADKAAAWAKGVTFNSYTCTSPDEFAVGNKVYAGGEAIDAIKTIKWGNELLEKDTDYLISYSNNVNASQVSGKNAEVTITFINDCQDLGTVEAEFVIEPFALTAENTEVKMSSQDAYIYNGEKQYPEIESVTVKIDDDTEVTLSEDDYDVVNDGTTADIINVGIKRCTVVGKGNYSNYKWVDGAYTIQPANIADGVSVDVKPTAFATDLTIHNVLDNVTVEDKVTEEVLERNDDYKVMYYDEKTGEYTADSSKASLDVGVHKIRIYGNNTDTFGGSGNFLKDTYVETSYEIVKSSSLAMMVEAGLDGQLTDMDGFDYDAESGAFVLTYDGEDHCVDADELHIHGLTDKECTFKVEGPDEWINVGDYSVTVEGKNTYAGETVSVPLRIVPKNLNTSANSVNAAEKIAVEATQGKSTDGGDGDLFVKVTDNAITNKDLNKELTEGKDYTYETVTEGDDKYVVITGIGNYTTAIEDDDVTTLKVKVKVDEKINLADSSISAELTGTYKYTGKQIKPSITDVKLIGADGKELPVGELKISYGENKAAGEDAGSVTISAKDTSKKYYGSRTIEFDIVGDDFAETFKLADIKDFEKGDLWKDILDAIKVVYQNNGATYATHDNDKKIEVEITKDGEEVKPKDTNKAEAGVYNVKVTPVPGQYVGELTTTINVIGDDLKTSGAKIADIADQVYTSEAIEPDVVVTIGNKTLEEGKDYTVSYTDNVKGGEATAIVTGIGEYSGTIEKNFNIKRAAQSIVMTNPLQERDLANGSRNTKSKVCTLKLATTMADEDTKYTYKSSDLSVATVNDGKITYKGVGECTITVTAAETDSCEAASLDIAVKVGKPGQPTFTPSVTSKTAKKSFTVTSSTIPGADGFEVQYSVRSDWWRASTVDFDGTNGKLYRQTIKTYHSNKKYYIRVRAYQVVDGAKVYSDWSPVKTATTK